MSRTGLKFEALEARLPLAADFGDAPAPYPTTLAEGGAQHVASGPMLGAARDQEADGVHSANAAGEGADDDGVVFGTLQVGRLGGTATVTVTGASGSGAKLDAWIDFNGDGNWGGPEEEIASSHAVVNGSNQITFEIPSSAVTGVVFARFRLSTLGNLGVSGAAADGEVEDYAITINSAARASGQFNAGQDVGTSLNVVQQVIALDVDADGLMDLVSAEYGTDSITWHRRSQAGAYTKHTIASGVDGARSVFAADINGDGKLDVVSAAQLGNKLFWHEHTGGTAFTTRTVSDNVPKATSVVAADLDGDGDTDVISGGNNAVRWFENTGNSAFTSRALPLGGTGISSVAVANVDGDGDLDIIYAAATSGQVGWYRNNGSEVFTHVVISSTAAGASSVVAADLDDDGDVDVVSSNSSNKVAWYENTAQAFTTRIITSSATGAGSVSVADVDGDGDLDVLADSAIDNKIAWHQNDGDQNFVERVIATDASSVRSVGAADLDKDGDLDVFAAQAGNARVRRFENRALGNYLADAAVDGSDFLLWQRTLGPVTSRGAGADGDGSNAVDAGDLGLWRQGYGWSSQSSGGSSSGSSTSVSFGSGFRVQTGTVFLAAELFDQPTEAPATSALLAEEESQQSTGYDDRDAALSALALTPHAVSTSTTLIGPEGEGEDEASTVSTELEMADWGFEALRF